MVDYYDRVQRSVDFIEERLTQDIELEAVAKEAYCSLFHFHRIFQALIGDSMKEYIRKRRLSLAGREIACSDIKIIDIALKYGYETPEAFTKAFKKFHGMTPMECRKLEGPFVFREKVSVITYKTQLVSGGRSMNYKIIEKDEFKIVGREIRVRNDNGDNYKSVPQFWKECLADGIYEKFGKLKNRVNPKDNVVLGMCSDFDGINTFSYFICTEVSNSGDLLENMVQKTIPSAKYAVFTAKGKLPEAIQGAWKEIYGTWFLQSGYERTDGPDFELYDKRCEINDENCEVDIYIPIK